jgi:hypothetical protein
MISSFLRTWKGEVLFFIKEKCEVHHLLTNNEERAFDVDAKLTFFPVGCPSRTLRLWENQSRQSLVQIISSFNQTLSMHEPRIDRLFFFLRGAGLIDLLLVLLLYCLICKSLDVLITETYSANHRVNNDDCSNLRVIIQLYSTSLVVN